MRIALDADHILLGQEHSSKHSVIQAIGDIMMASGDVTPRYVEGMFRKEEQFNTCITEGVALPHGTNDVKDAVLRSSVVFVQMPGGTDWGDGKRVYLAIGVAGRGDEQHLQLLGALARVLQDGASVASLRTAKDKEEVIAILKKGSSE
jgi:mannitol/fructose-specific phosphotransferase system IIA component